VAHEGWVLPAVWKESDALSQAVQRGHVLVCHALIQSRRLLPDDQEVNIIKRWLLCWIVKSIDVDVHFETGLVSVFLNTSTVPPKKVEVVVRGTTRTVKFSELVNPGCNFVTVPLPNKTSIMYNITPGAAHPHIDPDMWAYHAGLHS
jgi:hypothetical protein